MFGRNANRPNDITKRLRIDIVLLYENFRLLLHNNRLNNGERINRMEGMPMMRCNLRGKGKIPAPAIDIE
jgi:hypothetical protein